MIYYNGTITLEDEYCYIIEFCDYCISLCEDIFLLVKDEERTNVEIDKDKIQNFEKLTKDELHDKLLELGLLDNYYHKKLFTRLLLDFSLYMRQSIENVKNFNPHIAFTLCRKPLVDDLHYFEKFLLDKNGTIKEILNTTPKQITNNQIKEVSKKVQDKFNNNLIDTIDFRCGNKGLNLKLLSDKSLHIITDKHELIKTNKGELNFVFMESNELNQFTKEYLKYVPFVLIYAINIIFILLNEIYYIDKRLISDNLNIFNFNMGNVTICIYNLIKKDVNKIEIPKLSLYCNKCNKTTIFKTLFNKSGRFVKCCSCNLKTYYNGLYKGENK